MIPIPILLPIPIQDLSRNYKSWIYHIMLWSFYLQNHWSFHPCKTLLVKGLEDAVGADWEVLGMDERAEKGEKGRLFRGR